MNNVSYTSSEVKQRWENKAYKKFLIRFREDTDKEMIDYIEANKERFGTTEIFRAAMEALIKNGEFETQRNRRELNGSCLFCYNRLIA